jgi:hypothetical protein
MAKGQRSDEAEVGDDYEDEPGTDPGDGRLLERRGYLKLAGVAVATVASAAGTGVGVGGTTRRGIEFDRVVDAVEDLGLDPTGDRPVNDRLEAALDEGTLVRFPDGDYQFSGQLRIDQDRVGFLGDGDVRFVPPTGFSDLLISYLSPPDEVLIENVDIDMREDSTTTGIRLQCRNRFHIQDIEFLGRGLTHDSGQVSAFLLGISAEDGRGVLRNAVAKKGSRIDGYAGGNGRIGIWVGWSNKGTVRIEDCDFREFGNNGTYTSRTPGDVEVVDSYFLNNNAANIRIGGEGSYAENCTVEIDMEKYTGPPLGDISTGWGIRGIHVDQGVQLEGAESIPAGAEIRNCEVIGRNAPNGIALINLSPQGRSLTVKNTRLRADIDGMRAVRRGRPGVIDWREWQDVPPEPHWIRMENVSITGSASRREAVRIVGADGSVLRNCCIDQTGSNRDGVVIIDADDCAVEDSTIDVTGTAIDLDNATANTASISREGSCALPNGDEHTTGSQDHSGQYLEIDGGGVYDRVDYSFSVDGSVEAGDQANPSDTIDGSTVTGHVEGGVDSYWVTGEFTGFDIDADIPVRLGGETVDPDTLGSSEDTATTQPEDEPTSTPTDDTTTTTDTSAGEEPTGQYLEIDGSVTYDRVEYSFSVDGSVEAGDRANPSDTIDGSTVSGHVEGGIDSYWVTGEFTGFDIDTDVPVRLDGETVDPETLGAAEETPTTREVVIDGGGTTERVRYTFSVDGGVERLDANENDLVTSDGVSGQVEGALDSYRVTGEFTNFQLDGDVPVRIDGQAVDPDTLGADSDLPHELVVIGREDAASYRIETTGSVEKRGGMWGAEPTDEASGSVASGTVEDDLDTFAFSGQIRRMRIEGNASVSFQG